MKDYLIVTLIFIVIIIASFFLGRCTKECVVSTEYKVFHDTTRIITQRDSTVVRQAPADVYYYIDTLRLKDTVFLSKAFIAKIDTIMQHDTIYTAFYFPQMKFDLTIKHKPDTTIRIRDSVYFHEVTIKEREWWKAPVEVGGSFILGAVTGYVFGVIKK